jgi:hypothetical protein
MHLFAIIQNNSLIAAASFGSVCLLLMIAYFVSQYKAEKMAVIDRRSGLNETASVVIPYSDEKLQQNLLLSLCFITSLLLLPISFFIKAPLDLQSDSWITVFAVGGAGLATLGLLNKYSIIPTSFSAKVASSFLHKNLWISPGIRPGRETENFLVRKLFKITKYWLAYFLIGYGILWLMENAATTFGYQIVSFPSGAMTLLIVITLTISGIHIIIEQFRSLVRSNYHTGQLLSIHFVSQELTIDMQKVVNIADEFPEEVRDVFIELFTTIEGGNYRETTGSILRGILNIYKLQLINFGTERLEIENLGVAKALKL